MNHVKPKNSKTCFAGSSLLQLAICVTLGMPHFDTVHPLKYIFRNEKKKSWRTDEKIADSEIVQQPTARAYRMKRVVPYSPQEERKNYTTKYITTCLRSMLKYQKCQLVREGGDSASCDRSFRLVDRKGHWEVGKGELQLFAEAAQRMTPTQRQAFVDVLTPHRVGDA